MKLPSDVKKSNLTGALAAAFVGGAASLSAAHANTLTQSVSVGMLLSGSQSFSSSFNIAGLLSSNGLTGGVINSGNLSAYGFSDQNINQTSNSYTESYQGGYSANVYLYSYSYYCGWGSTCYAPVYGYAFYGNYQGTGTQTNSDTVVDTMLVQAGTSSGTGAVSEHFSSQYNGSYSYSRGNGTYGYDSVYVNSYSNTDAWSGALQASAAFNGGDLLSMAQSGLLSYSVSPQMGQFNLNFVTLTLDVSAAPVPEPTESALLVAGLALLALAARRRERERRQKALTLS